MEFYAIIQHEGKVYSWVEHPGNICPGCCDLYNMEGRGKVCDVLCKAMRSIVGSSTTHRFKEVHLET